MIKINDLYLNEESFGDRSMAKEFYSLSEAYEACRTIYSGEISVVNSEERVLLKIQK